MTDFILYLVIASAWIWGFNALFQEGHILEFVSDWWLLYLDDVSPDSPFADKARVWLAKPLFNCAACMSSVHGLLWFFLGLPICFHDALPIRMLIPFLICLCGLNYVIIKLTSKERIITEE